MRFLISYIFIFLSFAAYADDVSGYRLNNGIGVSINYGANSQNDPNSEDGQSRFGGGASGVHRTAQEEQEILRRQQSLSSLDYHLRQNHVEYNRLVERARTSRERRSVNATRARRSLEISQKINQINNNADFSDVKKAALTQSLSIELDQNVYDGVVGDKINIVRQRFVDINEESIPDSDANYSFLELGTKSYHYAAQEYKRGNLVDAESAIELSNTFVDIALGVTPFVGEFKDAYESIYGKNLVTGVEMSTLERSISGASFGFALATAGMGPRALKAIRYLGVRSELAQSLLNRGLELGLRFKEEFKVFTNYTRAVLTSVRDSVGANVIARFRPEYVRTMREVLDLAVSNGAELSGDAVSYLYKQLYYGARIRNEITVETLSNIGKRYDEIRVIMSNVTGITFNGTVTRGVERFAGMGENFDVFDSHIYNQLKSHRFSMPGERAVYTTIGSGELTERTIKAELGARENADILFQTRNFSVDNILDLTDNSVLRQLGITEDLLGDNYNITHIIGTLARKNNFKGIKVGSAADRTGINFILFGE